MPDVRCGIVVASTSAAAAESDDTTGPAIASWAEQRGYVVDGPHVVADGPPVEQALRRLIAADCAVIITTGGTGLSADDQTPERTRAVLDREAPGVAELIRQRGIAHTPLAALSRGVAGVAGRSLVVNLPGSLGGVRDGLAVLAELLDHALSQLGHLADDHVHPFRGGAPS